MIFLVVTARSNAVCVVIQCTAPRKTESMKGFILNYFQMFSVTTPEEYSLPANLLSYFKKLMAAIIITHKIIISISK